MINTICAWGMKPLVLFFTVLLLFTKTVYAQDEPLSTKKVYPISLPIEVSHMVGGTHLDSYVVQLEKGQRLHVQVENKTDRSRVYFDVVPAGTENRFGRDSSENSWSGVAPKSGDYEIRLVAYPAANYKLIAYLTGTREDAPQTSLDHSLFNLEFCNLRSGISQALWSAPAKRSGDGALDHTEQT